MTKPKIKWGDLPINYRQGLKHGLLLGVFMLVALLAGVLVAHWTG